MHPECSEFAKLMYDCYASHPLKKFLGHCTSAELTFMECNRRERNRKRKENNEKAEINLKNREKLNKEYQSFKKAYLEKKASE